MSTEPRDTLSVTPASRTPSRAPSLKKRSISLEQTTKEQVILSKGYFFHKQTYPSVLNVPMRVRVCTAQMQELLGN